MVDWIQAPLIISLEEYNLKKAKLDLEEAGR